MALTKKPIPVAKKAASVRHTAHFRLKKETPGTFSYEEIDAEGKLLKSDEALVGGLYLRKTQIGDTAPKSVSISVSY